MNQQEETKDERLAVLISLILHLLLFLIIIMPFFKPIIQPKEELSGILVTFGEVDQGVYDVADQQSEDASVETESEAEEEPETPAEPPSAPVEQVSKPTEVENSSITSPVSDSPIQKPPSTSEEPTAAEVAAQRKKEAEERRQAEDAKRKAELEAKKKQFGNLFGQGSGTGGQTGNQGDPEGDPSSDALDGLSKGQGNIGGGLVNRGLLFEPNVEDRSQKTGVIVMDVCVNSAGVVTEATWTQKGSTTTDSDLKRIAQKAAMKYKFTPSDVERQCGSITISFKVRG